MSIYISHILTQPFFLVLPPLFLYHKPDYTVRYVRTHVWIVVIRHLHLCHVSCCACGFMSEFMEHERAHSTQARKR